MSSTVRYVDHTYRDFSRYIEDGGQLIKHKKCGANFPAKLHKLLSDDSFSPVITWMPHGRAWKVLDKERLISSALPEYDIACKKYESFTRQLNGWGFKRLYQSGPDLGCYYHECFLRGLPKLTTLVRRLPPLQGKATPYPAGEPNFYRISEVYPLPPQIGLAQSNQSTGSNPAVAAAGSIGEPSALDVQSREQSQGEIQYASAPTQPLAGEFTSGFASAAPALPPPGQPSDRLAQERNTDTTALVGTATASQIQLQHETQQQSKPPAHGFGEAASFATPPHTAQQYATGPSMLSQQPPNVQYTLPPQESLGGLATPHTTPYQYSAQMPQYTPSYQQQPPSHPSQFSTPHPSHYTPVNYDYTGQLSRGDYGQYPTPGLGAQQTTYQTHEPPRFRYPPPPPPQYYRYPPHSVQSVDRTAEQQPQYADSNVHGRYSFPHTSSHPAEEPLRPDRATGQSVPREPPEGDDRRRREPPEGDDDGSPVIEPIPYTPSREEDAGKKPDPPT